MDPDLEARHVLDGLDRALGGVEVPASLGVPAEHRQPHLRLEGGEQLAHDRLVEHHTVLVVDVVEDARHVHRQEARRGVLDLRAGDDGHVDGAVGDQLHGLLLIAERVVRVDAGAVAPVGRLGDALAEGDQRAVAGVGLRLPQRDRQDAVHAGDRTLLGRAAAEQGSTRAEHGQGAQEAAASQPSPGVRTGPGERA